MTPLMHLTVTVCSACGLAVLLLLFRAVMELHVTVREIQRMLGGGATPTHCPTGHPAVVGD